MRYYQCLILHQYADFQLQRNTTYFKIKLKAKASIKKKYLRLMIFKMYMMRVLKFVMSYEMLDAAETFLRTVHIYFLNNFLKVITLRF